MKYEEEKERGPNLSQHKREDGQEHKSCLATGNGSQTTHEREIVRSCVPRSSPQTDHLTINGSEPERSQENLSGNTKSLSDFVQKKIVYTEHYNASLSETSSFNSMNMELIRLGSFHNFPASRTVSTLKLARQGFYYNGEGDTAVCFACGAKKQNWRSEDTIEAIHRSMSPNCPLLTSLPTKNVQIGDHLIHGLSDSSVTYHEKPNIDSTSTYNLASNVPPTSTTHNTSNPSTLSTSRIGSDGISNNETEREPQVSNIETNSNTHTPPLNPAPIDYQTRLRIQQEQINAFLQDLDPLGINFDRPKYPSYAVVAVRVSSYSHWPSTLTQTPRDLSVAGFFYAGYGDYTRCFFCGGGLRNWEPGDDPWTEHARWFPKCAFIRQNKGDQFVVLVQIRQQELEALEASNGQVIDQPNDLGPTTNENHLQIDVRSLSAFKSVQEMGYQSYIIQEAFDLIKRTKQPMNIKAEDLLEVILDIEDNSGNNIPPSSVAGTEEEIRQSKDTTTRSNTETTNAKEKLKESSVKSKATGSAFAEADTTQSLLEENRQLKDLMICKICMENEASIAMLPCGHLCCCTDCAPAMRKCPVCGQFVKGTVRTWLA